MLPFAAGVLIWDEYLTVWRVFGLLLLTASLFAPVIEKRSGKKKGNIVFFLLCIGIFILNGFIGILSKYHQLSPIHVNETSFIVLYNIIAFPVALSLFFIFSGKSKNEAMLKKTVTDENKNQTKKYAAVNIFIVVMFAASNGIATLLMLRAASNMDASMLFPLVTGGTMLLTALASFIFYKEKPGKFVLAGLIIAIGATVLFVL